MNNQWTEPQFDRVALLTIDVQLDTLDGQPFEIPGTTQALPQIHQLCKAFRETGRPVVHVMRLYRPDGSNAELCRRDSLAAGEQMFLTGSRGRLIADEILPEDAPEPDDEYLLAGNLQQIGPVEWYMHKSRWGAFHNTALEKHLAALGVSTIILAGCNYPNCVRATVYEASARDLRIVAIKDAISNFTENGWRELSSIGIKPLSVAECINQLV